MNTTLRLFRALAVLTPPWLKLALVALACVAIARYAAPDVVYDAMVTARRPLVIINGSTQQLPIADYISSVGGITTSATAAAAGDIQTTTITSTGVGTIGGVTNTAQTRRTGVINVSLTESTSNWSPAGLATASLINVTPTNAWALTGLVAQPAGTEIVLRNQGPYAILLSDLHGASLAANQFDNGEFTLTLGSRQIVTLRHNGTNWVTMGTSGQFLSVTSLSASLSLETAGLRLTTTNWTATGISHDVNSFVAFQYDGAGDATVTGFLGGTQGQPKFVQNVSAFNLTLANETGSAAGRQIKLPGSVNLVLAPRCGALLTFETSQSYWQLQGYACDRISMPTTFTSTKNRGTITLVAGTGTATVLSGAVCTCSDTTATNAVRCAVAATTLTATGTGTDVIAYLCF